ncbi:MAG TPA: hypothetical protein VN736_21870 [Candidatus Limnocylindrales bacterium]|nr:hypothetical protein [Candidatus Limnocylindrales bacterium]
MNRATAGLSAAAVLCLCGALLFYNEETTYERQNADPYMVAAQAERLAPLAAAVPRDAVLGYITDAPGGPADTAMFTAAEYTLAPRLIERSANHEWVLGNFTHPGDFFAYAKDGLMLQRDFGNGVVLYRRAGKP